jgi:hypothetical protein
VRLPVQGYIRLSAYGPPTHADEVRQRQEPRYSRRSTAVTSYGSRFR